MMKKLYAGIIIIVLAAASAVAGIEGELGILDMAVNGGINPSTGQSWKAGDKYRLIFVTSETTQATSTDIDTYNAFVQGLSDAAGLGSVTWKVVGSTAAVDARDNTSTNPAIDGTGEAVFLMDGATVIANNYADLWDGIVVTDGGDGYRYSIQFDENGNVFNSGPTDGRVFTGSNADGTVSSAGQPLGGSSADPAKTQSGAARKPAAYNFSPAHWMLVYNDGVTGARSVYGMSEPLTIINANNASPVSPTNGEETVIPANPLTLVWTNPKPVTGDTVYVDVWFGTVPGSADQNEWKKVVSNGINTTSVDVDASAVDTYYWKVVCDVGDIELIEGDVWSFTTIPPSIADSDIFSVNFYAGSSNTLTLEADQSAGVGDWNKTGWINYVIPWGIGSPVSQVISSSEGSTATFILKEVRNGGSYSGTRTTLLDDGNADLMDGHANGTEDPYDGSLIFDMEVSNVPLGIYDVVIYLGSQAGQFGDGTGNIVFNGGPVQEFTLPSGRFNGTLTEIVDSETAGNYIVFNNVKGSSFTVQVWGNGFNHIGPCGFQFGLTDTSAPSVHAGSDWITWSGEPVTLNNVTIVNNDPDAGELTLTWTAEPVDGVTVVFSDNSVKEPTVTLTKTADTGLVTPVKLTLNVAQFGKVTEKSSITVDVYDDACKASLAAGATVIGLADFDGNCFTGFEDIARMATAWLVDYSFKQAVEK